jgi:GDP-L-fucose synthase|tara:strand:- start:176 stop:1108 length:933 start_codon:yes stop_codon:yes gene_type:complete
MNLLVAGKRVLVTGGNGFLGSRIVSILEKKGISDLVIPDSKSDDLRIKENCSKVTKNIDIVFHTAAKVGGIGLNQEKPGELFYDNLMMGVNLIEESRKNNVEKFISLGTICSYPKFTPIPFKEENIWDGYPEETNAPYGLAKKMLLVQSNAYKEQYGFRSITVFPTNLYGPGDNFNDNSSHVIPALIKKIQNAIKSNHDSIVLWGDGTPTRDFLFVDDAAKGIILAADKYEKTEPLNLGSGEEISINHLAQLIMKIMNVNLKIKFDTTKPNGQPRRCIDTEKAKNEIGFIPKTSLDVGLKQTIDWYLNKN